MLSSLVDTGLDNSCETTHLRHEVVAQGIHLCSLLGALLRGEHEGNELFIHVAEVLRTVSKFIKNSNKSNKFEYKNSTFVETLACKTY